MGFIEAVLALVGLAAAVDVIARRLSRLTPRKPDATDEDLAAPYREGLHAAVRLQLAAQEFEQRIYAEAAKHSDIDPGEPGP